ncbi:MAG: CPBP family intramembrane metalloprotease [Deltaproteobacteria bacterium]|nr:MAG: CPBP family intramembrane metalloprotease [Deltaproteobacteria bacterium]
MPKTLLLLLVVLASACSRPLATARLDAMADPLPGEIEAAARWEQRACTPALGVLWPGLGQACLGQTEEAAVLATATAVEVAATVVLVREDPELTRQSTLVPIVGLQNLWVYGLTDVALSRRRAAQMRYVPQDSLGDLLVAPFNPQVLKRPTVWAGTLGLLGGATALVALTEPASPGSPTLFGRETSPAVGWAGTFTLGTALFSHVAIGEEIAFRGLLQSDLARSMGEVPGWLAGSAVFGATHALNAMLLPESERVSYLLVAVPWITLAGTWLGHTYRQAGYSLAAPVAVHFWYDLLVTAVSVAHDPSSGIFAMHLGGRL